jgi:hypothetical protein
MYRSDRDQSQQYPVLNGCSGRHESDWSHKKQTLESMAVEIYHAGFRARFN